MNLALIDADILVYESAHRAQSSVEWEPGEWTHSASMPDAIIDFSANIEDIKVATKAEEAILVLSTSDRESNFRRKCWPGYKEKRGQIGANRPLLYKALREYVRDNYVYREKPGIEGDDALGILATGKDINGLPPVDQRVICSVDKDLRTVPGHHFNWRKPELGVVYVDELEANYNHMLQTLTGDSTDGYPGLPGIGKVRAERLLAGIGTPEGRWTAVLNAYRDKNLTLGDALAQARCARILQACDWDFEKNEPKLWEPPS